ncbi:hypothetical protein Q8A67_019556 [Cirrhinus molitorella]|uniref:Transposase n=1 Tax=Cirrhinus molitorella TaxID=172907 RepID=A0AA88PER1_9TELE|nr:hypothetical protein Q8A67_019556 [Cirrhinus molitorella]
MGKTADLTAVQKAIIDTLKQEVGSLWEGKSVAENTAQREGDLRKQCTESGVETSRATVYRRVQEMGYRCRIP